MATSDTKPYADEEAVAVALAQHVVDLSAKFLKYKQFFTVVLSGDTLIHTLRKLQMAPYKEKVNWARWKIFWVYERDSPDSNYKLAHDEFLSRVGIPEGNIYPMMPNDRCPTPQDAANHYNVILAELVDSKMLPLSGSTNPKFDLMLLGTGPSGTVGSLFPNRPQADMIEPWVTFLTDAPENPPGRVTFTFPVINSTTEIALVATGIKSALLVFAVVGGHRPPGLPTLPVERIHPTEGGKVTWFLDQDAAAFLPKQLCAN